VCASRSRWNAWIIGVGAPGTTFFSREHAHSTEPNVDVGGVVEFYTRQGLILRLDIADSVVSYGRRTIHISDSVPDIQAGGFTTYN
jgi:hypothetical protein